ncbi:Ger(x)C family spore germination protein [Priestia megaterium]|nr:Ger(x)C family spore germination protein [Priestia megaterium]
MNQIKKKRMTMIVMILFLLTGCWDRRELNDRAVLLGWGMDYIEEGTYRATAQFAVPDKLITGEGTVGQGRPFFIATGEGINIRAAADDMTSKMSRFLFAGHRRGIILGEALAKDGLKEIVDEYSRYIIVRIRTDMFVVKGGSANQLLKQPYPIGRIPINSIVKIHEVNGGNANFTLKDFLISASSETSSPVLPTVEVVSQETKQDGAKENPIEPTIKYFGIAIFNPELKLLGYLKNDENLLRLWLMGGIKERSYTFKIPDKGTVSMDMNQLKGKVTPLIKNGDIRFNIKLSGNVSIIENNTPMDLSKKKNIEIVQSALNKDIEKKVKKTIQKLQQKYKADIFGFDGAVHRKYPYEWKTLKKDWTEKFSKAEISVKVQMKVRKTGQIIGPLHRKEQQ